MHSDLDFSHKARKHLQGPVNVLKEDYHAGHPDYTICMPTGTQQSLSPVIQRVRQEAGLLPVEAPRK
jgi:hypothetical protein